MSTVIEGGCRCGGVRYAIDAAPFETRICHCRDCQYASGGPFSVVAFFAKERVSWFGLTPKHHAVTGSQGLTVRRSFCPECGTPLCSEVAELPKLICIKTGSLDDPAAIAPTGQMWFERKLSWLQLNHVGDIAPQNPPIEHYR